MAGNRLPGFYVQRIRNRRFKADFKDTGMNQVAVLEVRFLGFLPIDEGSVQAAQVVQQNGVAGEIRETGMMAGDTGVVQDQIVDLRPADGDRRCGQLKDLRRPRFTADDQSRHATSP